MDKSATCGGHGAKGGSRFAVVKKERGNEDIKEFAETAMNELLGWYGYGKEREAQRTESCKSQSNSGSSGPDSPKYNEGCGWCGKTVDESTGISSGSAVFCTELCFSQSRRANFKKNKTCDWCRHVRHTVSYVDFQDGASQLQFCSDKCLNQYKMHIFCRETRAHLEMHPHLISEDSASGLITPDLWMKNCKSPNSRSPSPPPQEENRPQTSPLPLISVAHPSKLLASPPELVESKQMRSKPVKRMRKRPPSTITNFPKISESPQDLRIRHSPVADGNPEKRLHEPFPPPDRPPFGNFLPPEHMYMSPPMFSHPGFPFPPRPPPNVLPPVTVMVPFPVMIPIPIPVPIPLPLTCFAKAADIKAKNEANHKSEAQSTVEESSQMDEKEEIEIVVDDPKDARSSPVRPPRKRKRVVDSKSKIVIKTKKSLSV